MYAKITQNNPSHKLVPKHVAGSVWKKLSKVFGYIFLKLRITGFECVSSCLVTG